MIINLSTAGYEVIEPGKPGHGQFYPSYCEQWTRWIVSNNPESTNYGPVHFLHCVSCPEQQGASYGSQIVVRIGSQATNINAGEYVFLPVLSTTAETVDSGIPDNPTALLNYVRMDLEAGDNPPHPEQATICDTKGSAKPTPIVTDLAQHLIITNVFPLYVPPLQQSGSQLRTCFDVPITTEGVRNCVVGGWWLLIQFKTPNTSYYIHTFSRGSGQYQAGMFHQINVLGASRKINPSPSTTAPIDWSKDLVKNAVKKKHDDGVIGNTQFDHLDTVILK
jgi:hypothetical protein